MTAPATWQNRIVGYEEMRAGDLLANPNNFRIHPTYQQQALAGVLREVGLVQNVIVNTNTGNMIDGHLRVVLTLREFGEDALIPVTKVDLTDAEEKIILATYDPISALAATDAAQLAVLLSETVATDDGVNALLDDLRTRADNMIDGKGDGGDSDADGDPEGEIPFSDSYKEQYGVIVICDSEENQQEVFESLSEMGLNVKVVTT